jgi:inhibitor of cysteine peptidase
MSRPKLVIATVLVFTFGLSAWASDKDEKPARNETRLNAQLHRSFRIVVDSNPSTGYSWTVDFDKSFLKLESSRYERPAQQIPGRGGKHVFVFLPLRAGETVIELQHKRPWEPASAESRKYSISIAPTGRGN